MTKVSGKAHARRPVNYWCKFNEWWRQVLEESGRRPDAAAINRWYEENARDIWAPNDLPTMVETRVHAKCLRSVDEVRNYFRAYRAQRRADAVARAEAGLTTDEAEDDDGTYLSAATAAQAAIRRAPGGPNSNPESLTGSQRGGVSKVVASAVRISRPAGRTGRIHAQLPSTSSQLGTLVTISGFGESNTSLPGGSWWRQQQPQTGHQPQTGQNPRCQRKQVSGRSGGLAGSSIVITGYPYQQNPATRHHAASAVQSASPASGPEHGVVNGQEGRVDIDAEGPPYDDSEGPCSSVSTASLDAMFCGLPPGSEVDTAHREGWRAYAAPLPMAAPVGVVVSTGIRERRVSGGGGAGGAGVTTGPPQQHPQLPHPGLASQQPRGVQEAQRQQELTLQRLSQHQQISQHGSNPIVGRNKNNNTALIAAAPLPEDLGTIFDDEPMVHAEVTLLPSQAAKQHQQQHQQMHQQQHQQVHQHQMMMLGSVGTHSGPGQEAAPGHVRDAMTCWPPPTPPTHPHTSGAPVTTGAHQLNRQQQQPHPPLQQQHYTLQQQAPQRMRHNAEQQSHFNTTLAVPPFSSDWLSGNREPHQLAGGGAPGGGVPVPQHAAVVATWGCTAPQGTEGSLGDVRAMEGVVCGAPVSSPGDWVSAPRDTPMGLRAVRSEGGAQGSSAHRRPVHLPCSQLMPGPQVVQGGRAQADVPAPMSQSAQPPSRATQQLSNPLPHLGWAHEPASQPLGLPDPQLQAPPAPSSATILHRTPSPAWLKTSQTDLPSAGNGDAVTASPWSSTIAQHPGCSDVCAGSGPVPMLFSHPVCDLRNEVATVTTLPPLPLRRQGDRPALLPSLGGCSTTSPAHGAPCPGSTAAAVASWSAHQSQSPPQQPPAVCAPQLGVTPLDPRILGVVTAPPVAMTMSPQLLPQQAQINPLPCHHSQSAPIQVHAQLDVTKGLPSFHSGSWASGPSHHGVQVLPTGSAPVPFDVSHLVEQLRTHPTRAPCPPSLAGGATCLGDGGGASGVGGVRSGSGGQRSPSVTTAAAFRRHSQPGGDLEAYMAGLQQQQQQQYMLQRPRQQQEQAQQQGGDTSRYPMMDLLQQWQRGDQTPGLRASLSDSLATLSGVAQQGPLMRTDVSGTNAQPQALDRMCNNGGAMVVPGGPPATAPGAAAVQQVACTTDVFRSNTVAAAAATTSSLSQATAATAAPFALMPTPAPSSAAEPSRSAFKGTLSAPLGDSTTPLSAPAANLFNWPPSSEPVQAGSQPPQAAHSSMMQPCQAPHLQTNAIPQLAEHPALTAGSGLGFDIPGLVSGGFGSPGGGSWGDRALAELEGDSAWFASLLAADIPPAPLAYY